MKQLHLKRWFLACISLLLLNIPPLISDELPLFISWLLVFSCWLLIIILSALSTARFNKHSNEP